MRRGVSALLASSRYFTCCFVIPPWKNGQIDNIQYFWNLYVLRKNNFRIANWCHILSYLSIQFNLNWECKKRRKMSKIWQIKQIKSKRYRIWCIILSVWLGGTLAVYRLLTGHVTYLLSMADPPHWCCHLREVPLMWTYGVTHKHSVLSWVEWG